MIADFNQLENDLAENRNRRDKANISFLTRTVQLDTDLILDVSFELVSFTELDTMSINITKIVCLGQVIDYNLGDAIMNEITEKLFELIKKRTKVS